MLRTQTARRVGRLGGIGFWRYCLTRRRALGRVKQYLQNGWALRIETVINDPRDLLCKRRRQHLDELQAKGRAINAHLLDTERVGQRGVSPARWCFGPAHLR